MKNPFHNLWFTLSLLMSFMTKQSSMLSHRLEIKFKISSVRL